jgi:hypothetical protein
MNDGRPRQKKKSRWKAALEASRQGGIKDAGVATRISCIGRTGSGCAQSVKLWLMPCGVLRLRRRDGRSGRMVHSPGGEFLRERPDEAAGQERRRIGINQRRQNQQRNAQQLPTRHARRPGERVGPVSGRESGGIGRRFRLAPGCGWMREPRTPVLAIAPKHQAMHDRISALRRRGGELTLFGFPLG